MTLLLLANAASTWFMTGVIWFVQLVHYRQFDGVGAEGFVAYHRRHTRWTTVVVLPAMVVEAGTAVGLVVHPPRQAPAGLLWVGVGLVVALWGSTFLVQVPCHDRLARGFDAGCWRRLCRTNWVRTALWTTRSGLTGYVLWRVMA